MVDRYIVLWRLEQSSSEYTRADISRIHVTSHYTKYTSDLDLLRHSRITVYMCTMHLSKMDHNAKPNITVNKQEVHIRETARPRSAIFNGESRNVTNSNSVSQTFRRAEMGETRRSELALLL